MTGGDGEVSHKTQQVFVFFYIIKEKNSSADFPGARVTKSLKYVDV